MPLDISHVYDIAADLLTSVCARLDAALTEPLPARRYVHAGEVAFDCEQVVVTVPEAGLTHAFPGESAKVEHCSPPRHVALQVWINRCVPVPADDGTPPTADALDASAEVVLADLWSLAYVLWEGYRAEEWGSRCATLILGPVSIVGPEGGHVAVRADVFLLVT